MTRLICALDTADLQRACQLAESTAASVDVFKLGLEFFCAHGHVGVLRIADYGKPIFLDLKLHDIPNTVSKAIHSLKGLPIAMLTVHTLGGEEMLKAAQAAFYSLFSEGHLLGVTVLTSVDGDALAKLGMQKDVMAQVLTCADVASKAGLDGLVSSALELEAIKRAHSEMVCVVPGIRPEWAEMGDQKRIMTPKQAADQGADYIVVGRPITEADNPAEAAASIQSCLHNP